MKYDPEVEVLWVDDEKIDHNEDAENLEHARKELSVKIVHPSDLHIELSRFKSSGKMPDLFLIDYFLDQVGSGENGKFEQRGLSIGGALREIGPEHPMYVVTQKYNKVGGIFISEARAAKECFDKILTFKEVQREGHNILYYDALDYRRIRESPRRNLNALFELLQAPDDVSEKLRLILPDELRIGLSPKRGKKHPEGNVIAFARWVRNILLNVPGILYNELYASTYMGMNTKYFKKISSKLKRAEYSGVFAKTTSSLWWISELNNILFSKPKAQKSHKTNPWEVAPVVFGVPKANMAKCAICKGFFPETVGINLKDDDDLRPVHYKCSVSHPQKKRELYFDEPRGFDLFS